VAFFKAMKKAQKLAPKMKELQEKIKGIEANGSSSEGVAKEQVATDEGRQFLSEAACRCSFKCLFFCTIPGRLLSHWTFASYFSMAS